MRIFINSSFRAHRMMMDYGYEISIGRKSGARISIFTLFDSHQIWKIMLFLLANEKTTKIGLFHSGGELF
jgi:hypothetical protein